MIEKDKKALKEYIKTINKIDDHFEYSNESKKDREYIHARLDELTKNLKNIYNSK